MGKPEIHCERVGWCRRKVGHRGKCCAYEVIRSATFKHCYGHAEVHRDGRGHWAVRWGPNVDGVWAGGGQLYRTRRAALECFERMRAAQAKFEPEVRHG